MNFSAEHQAIESFFVANWNGSQCPACFENIQTKQPDSSPWCRLAVLNATTYPAAIGLQKIRTPGIVVLQIFAKSYDGVRKLRQLADTFAGIFNGQHLQVGAGMIRFEVTSIKPIGLQNGWYQINAEVPFQHDSDERVIVIQNNQFEVSLSHVGVAVDDLIFGLFEPTRACNIVAVTVEAQDSPVGADLSFDLINGAGVEQGKLFKLSEGQNSAKTIFSTPYAMATGGRVSVKIKQVGSAYAGQNLHIKLMCVNQ